MKAIQRIPTTQYGYIELEMEYSTAEEAFIDHERLLKLHEGGAGLDSREWKKVREHMLRTGEADPNDHHLMNNAQKWWINEVKLGLRGLKGVEAEEPVIN
jgi:hypothetical protein